jgi:hypothetical protein
MERRERDGLGKPAMSLLPAAQVKWMKYTVIHTVDVRQVTERDAGTRWRTIGGRRVQERAGHQVTRHKVYETDIAGQHAEPRDESIETTYQTFIQHLHDRGNMNTHLCIRCSTRLSYRKLKCSPTSNPWQSGIGNVLIVLMLPKKHCWRTRPLQWGVAREWWAYGKRRRYVPVCASQQMR